MFYTRVLLQQRQPMIRFLGKRSTPSKIDHTPHAHPASPNHELPESFASYRQKAQQHGPLGGSSAYSTSALSRPGKSLGPIEPAKGEAMDRNDLPFRFRRTSFSPEEIDAIDSGGASLYN